MIEYQSSNVCNEIELPRPVGAFTLRGIRRRPEIMASGCVRVASPQSSAPHSVLCRS